jgi:Spy/CpxP family protein refolding chaperone
VREVDESRVRNTAQRSGFEKATKEELKNSMRNKIFAIALGGMLALGATAAVFAQDQTATPGGQQQGQWGQGHRGMMNPDKQLEHMTKTLNLTADQQTQIKPILTERQQKMQALWQDQSLSREDRHSKAEAIHQDTRSRIEAVLNDQQKQQFEAMQQRGPRGNANRPQGVSPQ